MDTPAAVRIDQGFGRAALVKRAAWQPPPAAKAGHNSRQQWKQSREVKVGD